MIKWYDMATFYHIYPLGFCGVAKQNDGVSEEHHFDKLKAWLPHIADLGCTAIYIGPLFESVGHGYETTDYKKVDRRLGTNEEFADYVKQCHKMGIQVIVDGVFNHTGREFFAFRDIKEKREQSPYKDWYCNVNFWGNNEYNDGFSYDNWGGYNLLVKLNQRNPEVQNYIYDVIRFWVSEFNIDGIRLDAADVLDFDFMKGLRHLANEVKEDFWLMGEVIHGDYSRWANGETLHSVTNYELHKGLYSGHNDHNYFEIAHTIRRLEGLCGQTPLYNFVDNHDVARIYNKLNNKAHLIPVHILLFTLPGIPSIYYGSEFAIEGAKEKGSDDSLRPCLDLEECMNREEGKELLHLLRRLGQLKQELPELSEGTYKDLMLTNRQFAFARMSAERAVVTAVNNDDNEAVVEIPLPLSATGAIDLITLEKFALENGKLHLTLPANGGKIVEIADF
jgi:glycosidase